jgi:predicted component of type VI protein secretion system
MATVTDEIIDLHDRIIGKLFNAAKNKHQQQFQASGKAINDKVRMYGRIGQALLEAKQSGGDPFAAIEAVMPWDTFAASVTEAQKLAQPAASISCTASARVTPRCAAMRRSSWTCSNCAPRPPPRVCSMPSTCCAA